MASIRPGSAGKRATCPADPSAIGDNKDQTAGQDHAVVKKSATFAGDGQDKIIQPSKARTSTSSSGRHSVSRRKAFSVKTASSVKREIEEEEAEDEEDEQIMRDAMEEARAMNEPQPVVYANLTEKPWFTGAVMTCICINALQMGLELQFTSGVWLSVWSALEHFFTFAFLIEFCVKMYILTPRGFISEKSNCLDGVIVIVAVLDNWLISVVMSPETMSSLGFISILRLVRLSRILKLLRSRRELMLLLEGILSSIRSMMWLSVLLGILIYTCAICFVQFIGSSDVYPVEEFDNKKYFGDLVAACMTGLNLALMSDWSEVIRPLLKYQPHFAMCITIYVGIASFGIMNAIIGVIVSRTSQASKEAEEEDHLKHQNEQMEFISEVSEIVYELDVDGTGSISREEMKEADQNEELREALDLVELPFAFKMSDLHTMLDKDGDGELSKSEFYIGMKRLIFSNEFQSQCLIMLAIAQMKRRVCDFRLMTEENFGAIHEQMMELRHGQEKLQKLILAGPTTAAEKTTGEFTPADKAGGPYTIAIKGAAMMIQTSIPPAFQSGSMSLGEIIGMDMVQQPPLPAMNYDHILQGDYGYGQHSYQPQSPYGQPPGMQYDNGAYQQDNGAYQGDAYQQNGYYQPGSPNHRSWRKDMNLGDQNAANNGMRDHAGFQLQAPPQPGGSLRDRRPRTSPAMSAQMRTIDTRQGLLPTESVV